MAKQKPRPKNPRKTSPHRRPRKNFPIKAGFRAGDSPPLKSDGELDSQEPMRLNRFIAHSGICGRREADTLIERGEIAVNGKVVKELGTKVIPGIDKVIYKGKEIYPEKKVYVLYNKPKNEITTLKDPKGRPTVMDVMKRVTDERIFPVGRLDRNTTGLLLFTNDGDLAKKLTHPSHKVRKVYKVKLNKPVDPEHLDLLQAGIELEDGLAKVDKISYVDGTENRQIGLEIHIGKNRVVRRMFENLGYQVLSLDRTMLGHLTKKNLPRGKWRFLKEKEIAFLKMT